jgi:hypothetical protein
MPVGARSENLQQQVPVTRTSRGHMNGWGSAKPLNLQVHLGAAEPRKAWDHPQCSERQCSCLLLLLEGYL